MAADFVVKRNRDNTGRNISASFALVFLDPICHPERVRKLSPAAESTPAREPYNAFFHNLVPQFKFSCKSSVES